MTTTDSIYRQKTFDLHDTDAQVKALHEDGFALIPGVVPANIVEQAREQIDLLTPIGFDRQSITDHYKCVFNRNPFWLQFIDWPGVIETAEASMGSECHIIGQSAWRSHPGHNGWGPHTDRIFFELPEDVLKDPRVKLPIYLCTAHFYLNDIDEDLCPTYVIPGSHLSGTGNIPNRNDPEFHGRKLEPVICKAGDVLIFRSEVWHTGSLNRTTDRTRYLLQVHYSHRYIAQQFSPYIAWQFNPEVLAACSPRQLRLLGNHSQGAYD